MIMGLAAAIERVMQVRVERAVPVSGGDINLAYHVGLANQRQVFVKANQRVPLAMFEAEAHGLEWLRASNTLGVPEVLACGGLDVGGGFLVLEWLEPGRPGPHFDERLGEGLAALHRFGAPQFGLERDNFIGRLVQCNRRYDTFQDFFVEQRLRAQFELAVSNGHFDRMMSERFERLLSGLGSLLGPEEPPARLHGDLWSGNYLVGPDGAPRLIDPAVYGGHREIDLAMMRLFGGFSERVFDAYAACYPLLPGHRERLPLMQLYPLLVHVNLFGGGYVASVLRIVDGYLR